MAKKASGSEEVVNHYGGIRIRVNGSGNLKAYFYSLDEIFYNKLLPIPMETQTNIQPTRIGNFTQQRAKLEIRTTEIDEQFNVHKIIILLKPVAKSFPQKT